MLTFYNYLTRNKEEFVPIGDTVGLYTCGPTVYDYVHIGNWRTFVFEDILRRVLEFRGYKVKHIMNITDIDDKIIARANKEKIKREELTKKYEKEFLEDLAKLNIKKANTYPKATKSIDLMVRLIEKLLGIGVAYEKDGSVYFSISKFTNYGKLSGTNIKGIIAGARVDADEYEKDNPQDFVLWKKHKKGEPVFDAPFGRGRPGWHIECSAMCMHHLGETFDIHTGGVDLLFPHHENEIAQSEAASGKKFVNYWLEGEHLLVNGEKMSKKLGNIFTLGDIVKKGFDPLDLRYLFLTAHYRSKLNFTWESIESAHNALNNLKELVSSWDKPKIGCAEYEDNFKKAVSDDLDIPKAISEMWSMAKSDYPSSAIHKSVLVMDKVFGLGLDNVKKASLPKGAKELIAKREKLRKAGKFNESDKLRDQLKKMGIEVEDTEKGPKWKVTHD